MANDEWDLGWLCAAGKDRHACAKMAARPSRWATWSSSWRTRRMRLCRCRHRSRSVASRNLHDTRISSAQQESWTL